MIRLSFYKCIDIKMNSINYLSHLYVIYTSDAIPLLARKSAIKNFKILVWIVTLVSIITILECQNKLKNSSVIQNKKDLKEQHFAVLIFSCVCDISLTHC